MTTRSIVKTLFVASIFCLAVQSHSFADTIRVTAYNGWNKPVTYANLWGYTVDFSSGTQVAYLPNVPALGTATASGTVPHDFVQYWGSFYFYDSVEFHQATCQAQFARPPKKITLRLVSDFSTCEIIDGK